ncbi:TonB-dependent receptor [Phenylobacterium sp. 20VBR1]|uniref:TonB-dependent receptor n=1 Tax=Phenylobacterium glaciei TaxID=2803784 RepID=A0A941HV13_9CAUL|nr:TonB-dependent receptor [Phenylobacterium glaciei]
MTAIFFAAGEADAAPERVRFNIAAKPYPESLIDLALQADISLLGASACGGGLAGGIKGAYTVEEALSQLLARAPCAWRVVGSRSVQIRPADPSVAAQTTSPPVAVSEVLVTATKRVQSTERLAVAVSVISAEQLAATGAADPGETSGQLAGVLTTNLGPSRDKLILRGLSDGAFTGRSRSTVGTYLDNTPINYNAPDPDLRLVDVERIEVVRGPQGALYGGGSLSGIYRIVTRKPDLLHASAQVSGSRSWTQDGAPSGDVEGYANLPLFDGAAGLRISAYQESQGGYLDDINLRRDNVDRTRRYGGRVSMSFQPNDIWTVDLSGTVQHLKSEDTHYTNRASGLQRASRVAEPHGSSIALVAATVRGTWGWGELVSSTGFVRHTYSSLYDASAVVDLFTANGSERAVYSDTTRTEMLVQDLVLTSRGAGPFQWLAGLYGSDTSETSPATLMARGPVGPLAAVYRDERRDRIFELAAYGEAALRVSPGWTVALGGRAFKISGKTTSDVVSERFAPRSFVRRADFAGVSPKVSLQWETASGNLVYAVISEGYRAGGINSGGARPLATARETFAPDRLRNYELGAKLHAFDGRLVAHSALFYDVWKNIQTDQFRPSGIPYTANVGDARVAGLETELAYSWDMGLTLQANALVSQTRIIRANPDYAPELTRGLPGAPGLSGGVLATYQRRVFGDLALRVVGEANYVGRSRVTFDPALSPEMGGYVRAKLSVGLSGRRRAAEVFITNPANALSDTFAYGNPFSFSQVRQVTPQRPRTMGVTFSTAF